MTTLHLVDPEQREAVAGILQFDPKHHGLAEFRGLMEGFADLLTPEPVPYEIRSIAGPDGMSKLRLLVHYPDEMGDKRPAILYMHGGGMIGGTAEMMAGAHRRLAQETGALVITPDYRLAPEFPFPRGLEDSYAALVWLYEHASELGVDPNRIAVMGDSGGGGLAAAVALLARDRGQVPLRAQLLLYPMLDIRTGTDQAPSDDPLTGEFIVNRALLRFCWTLVQGDAPIADDQRRYLSPALASDLQGLPPALIMTGALDLFRDENIAYAQRLLHGGVPTDLFVYAGAVHGFDMLPGKLAEEARADLMTAIRRIL